MVTSQVISAGEPFEGHAEADLVVDRVCRFDVVFASYGVLCWINSAAAWMRSAAACLRPGGAVVLIDIHPLVMMVGTIDLSRSKIGFAR